MIRFLHFMPRLILRHTASRRLRHVLILVPFLIGIMWVGISAVQGERGITALFSLETEMQHYNHKLKTLQEKNARLQRDILLLSGTHPDLDFLDERARLILGFTAPDDAILLLQ